MEIAKMPTNELRKCCIYTIEFSATKKKLCHSQVNGWNWKTSS
jgi:hypothetical protein